MPWSRSPTWNNFFSQRTPKPGRLRRRVWTRNCETQRDIPPKEYLISRLTIRLCSCSVATRDTTTSSPVSTGVIHTWIPRLDEYKSTRRCRTEESCRSLLCFRTNFSEEPCLISIYSGYTKWRAPNPQGVQPFSRSWISSAAFNFHSLQSRPMWLDLLVQSLGRVFAQTSLKRWV